MASKKRSSAKSPQHRWITPSDDDFKKISADYGGVYGGFFRKCSRCGCFRRIDAIRNSRMYIVKGGSWSNATAQAPKCIGSNEARS